jgi:hypothetical protein
LPEVARSQYQLLPGAETPRVFGEGTRQLTLVWRNHSNRTGDAEIFAQVYQAGSATAVPLARTFWKRLEILPGQTVIESAGVEFPAVRAKTHFIVQWQDRAAGGLGHADVLVYPTNLLEGLKPLADKRPIGLFDALNQLKPLLKMTDLEIEDLEAANIENFSGKLALIFSRDRQTLSTAQVAERISAIANRGVAVVWVSPTPKDEAALHPSFYIVPKEKGAIVMADAALVANLSEDPQSQLNLIYLSQLAHEPRPFGLPIAESQP